MRKYISKRNTFNITPTMSDYDRAVSSQELTKLNNTGCVTGKNAERVNSIE